MVTMNRLIVFAGLPGVGKTHLARQLAATLHAVYLRIDALESPFTPFGDLRDFGYRSASNVARENLLLGHDVIIDAVIPSTAPAHFSSTSLLRWTSASYSSNVCCAMLIFIDTESRNATARTPQLPTGTMLCGVLVSFINSGTRTLMASAWLLILRWANTLRFT